MPYKIVKRNQEKPFCVVKINPDESTSTITCYKTRDKAKRHKTALDIADANKMLKKLIKLKFGND